MYMYIYTYTYTYSCFVYLQRRYPEAVVAAVRNSNGARDLNLI